MTAQELLDSALRLQKDFDDHERSYFLSDRFVYIVRPRPEKEWTSRRRRRLDPRYVPTAEAIREHAREAQKPKATLSVHSRIRAIKSDDGDCIEVDDLTGAELIRMAEIRTMVDDWKNGKIAVLPPSTASLSDEDDED